MGERSGSEASKRLRTIRILAGPRPARTATERLAKIAEIASGKSSPDVFKNRNALKFDKKEDEVSEKKERKAKTGRDRMDSGGINREAK